MCIRRGCFSGSENLCLQHIIETPQAYMCPRDVPPMAESPPRNTTLLTNQYPNDAGGRGGLEFTLKENICWQGSLAAAMPNPAQCQWSRQNGFSGLAQDKCITSANVVLFGLPINHRGYQRAIEDRVPLKI